MVDLVKKSRTASSSKDGEFDTSTTVEAPVTTSSSPSPVTVFTPDWGAAMATSWPCSPNLPDSLVPMRPVPPTTTIFMSFPSESFRTSRSGFATMTVFLPRA